MAACVLLCLVITENADARGSSVRVIGADGGSVRVLVRSKPHRRCVITVHRGHQKGRRVVKMGRRSQRRVSVEVGGIGRIRAHVRCRRSRQRGSRGPKRVPLNPNGAVVVQVSGDSLLVYKGEGDRDLRPIYGAPLDRLGWREVSLDPLGDYYGHYVSPFSADFSRVLFDGVPLGDSAPHVGIIDFAAGTVIDLTAFRQGVGFSDPVLCEDNAGFVSQTGPVAGTSSDAFVFLSRTGTPAENTGYCFGGELQSSVSNPWGASAVDPARTIPGGRVVASEDGRYVFGEDGEDGFHAADGSGYIPVDCVPEPSLGEERNEFLLGWTGPRTVALAVSAVNNPEGAYDWSTATLNPDGTVTCAGGIPPTEREVFGISLSFDARAILFSAEGPHGVEKYRQPISGGPPERASYDDLPEGPGIVIYRVGPAIP